MSNVQLPHRSRRSIRLRGYDYSAEGAYFITICTAEKQGLFGAFQSRNLHLSEHGLVVRDEWARTPSIRPNVRLDSFVVMPDHFHAILFIMDCGRGVLQYAPTTTIHLASPSQTLGAIVRGFKGATTKRINVVRGTPGAKVWQRNYYEHVIRNEHDLHETRQYIDTNPMALTLKAEAAI
jgi:REP element-mobilizing transposase RayT